MERTVVLGQVRPSARKRRPAWRALLETGKPAEKSLLISHQLALILGPAHPLKVELPLTVLFAGSTPLRPIRSTLATLDARSSFPAGELLAMP